LYPVHSEWWAFEVVAIAAGWLDNATTALGAHTILFNVTSFAYMFYLGTSVAVSVRVGNLLGENRPKLARLASYLSLALGQLFALIVSVSIGVAKQNLAHIFTDDSKIVHLVGKVSHIVAIFQCLDCFNGVCNGIFRGTGKQSVGARVNLLAYYVFGLPAAYLLAFHFDMGLSGLWLGLTIGLALVCLICAIIVARTDWEAQAHSAQHRVSERVTHLDDGSSIPGTPLSHTAYRGLDGVESADSGSRNSTSSTSRQKSQDKQVYSLLADEDASSDYGSDSDGLIVPAAPTRVSSV
jgi:MATE family, multidrug and toxin extrusion protein